MLGSFLSVTGIFVKVGSTVRSHLGLNACLTMPGYATLRQVIKGEEYRDQNEEIFRVIKG